MVHLQKMSKLLMNTWNYPFDLVLYLSRHLFLIVGKRKAYILSSFVEKNQNMLSKI